MLERSDWKRIFDWVDDISGRAKRLYIGRSNFPERRLIEHRRDSGLNKLFALHWSRDREEIRHVEQVLIDKYDHLEQLENEADASAGSWGSGPHAVYIAWTWSRSSKAGAIGTLTEKTINEIPEEPGRSRFLYTSLSMEAAGRERARWRG